MPKNVFTAIAVLLIIVATLGLIFGYARYAVENAAEIFIDELLRPEFTRQKIAFITYGIAAILFIIGYRKEVEFR